MKVLTNIRLGNAKFPIGQILLVLSMTIMVAPSVQGKATAGSGTAEIGLNDKPVISEEVMGGKTFVVSKLLVRARPEQVWQVLADYSNASRVFPILKECELLENHGTKKITRHVIAPSGVPDTFEYVLEVHESAPRSMEWHRLKGDFKEVEGFWKLEPTEYGRHTMVTYGSYVNGGFLMPQILIRRQFHKDMPEALAALKNKAEFDNRIAARRLEASATH